MSPGSQKGPTILWSASSPALPVSEGNGCASALLSVVSPQALHAVLGATLLDHKTFREHSKEDNKNGKGPRGQDIRRVAEVLRFVQPKAGQAEARPYGSSSQGAERQHRALLSGDSDMIGGRRMELCKGRIRLGGRERFFTRGQWIWNSLPRSVSIAPSCCSSRKVWTALLDIGSEFWSDILLFYDSVIL